MGTSVLKVGGLRACATVMFAAGALCLLLGFECRAQEELAEAKRFTVSIKFRHEQPGREARDLVASGVVIGSIQDLRYALTVFSPCRILRGDELYNVTVSEDFGQPVDGWITHVNPLTGLTLVMFPKAGAPSPPSWKISDTTPAQNSQVRVLVPARDRQVKAFNTQVSGWAQLGVDLQRNEDFINLEVIGAPAFFESGALAGVVGAHPPARDIQGSPSLRSFCNAQAGRMYLAPIPHAMDLVSYLIGRQRGKEAAELHKDLKAVQATVAQLMSARESEVLRILDTRDMKDEDPARIRTLVEGFKNVPPPIFAGLHKAMRSNKRMQMAMLNVLSPYIAGYRRALVDIYLDIADNPGDEFSPDVREVAIGQLISSFRCEPDVESWLNNHRTAADLPPRVISIIEASLRQPPCSPSIPGR